MARIPKKSKRKMLEDSIKDILREILIIERGSRCELTGRPANGLGLFHILREGTYPRMKFHRQNLLLANWLPLHYLWHHDFKKAKEQVEPRIIQLRGRDYETKLLIQNSMQPMLKIFYMKTLKEALKQELKELKRKERI